MARNNTTAVTSARTKKVASAATATDVPHVYGDCICVVRVQDWLQVGGENITTKKISEQCASKDATNRAKVGMPICHGKCGTDDE